MKNRISLLLILLAISFSIHAQKVMRIGIIGLDTSHSTAFTELINSGSDETFSKGFRVVAAYPYGSKTILVYQLYEPRIFPHLQYPLLCQVSSKAFIYHQGL